MDEIDYQLKRIQEGKSIDAMPLDREQEELFTDDERVEMEKSAKTISKWILILTPFGLLAIGLIIFWITKNPAAANRAFSGFGGP